MDDASMVHIRAYYRIVWTDPPTLDDFQSHEVRGLVVRVEDPEILRLASVISVFRTISQARKMARKQPPWLGRGFIARIVIPADARVHIERTTKSAGHYTLWADAAGIASWVEAIEPVTVGED